MGCWIAKKPMDLNRLLSETEDPSCGGLVIFSGIVRNENEGKAVEAITYDAHIEIAENVLKELELEILEKFPVKQCRLQHRIGRLELGEPSVYVVVRSKHRAEAFEAARYGIDELKKRVPIWKEEHYKTGDSEFQAGVPMTVKERK
ncbi:molybdenum cofactor biosynthesis protein MoaE [Candidatus Acetothermia bacterium]|nr:molybdenum cofactor biosynthesis protein MoaE [Candidatus Acetothermia bacterium]MBI3644160.1 molybdenum cofactor biosynthesis protein MoaE [Candidatus Acetothermia bacterium]